MLVLLVLIACCGNLAAQDNSARAGDASYNFMANNDADVETDGDAEVDESDAGISGTEPRVVTTIDSTAQEKIDAFRALQNERPNDPEAWFEFGAQAWENGDGYLAQLALIAALDSRDDEGKALLAPSKTAIARGLIDQIYEDGAVFESMLRMHDFDAQERLLSHRLESRPDDARAFALRGFARRRLYRFEEAIADLINAQKLRIPDIALRSQVQKARLELERFGVVATQGGHDVNREFLYYDIREDVLAYSGRADWKGLERYLGDVMAQRSEIRPYVAIERGYLRISLGDFTGADEDFDKALESELSDASKSDIDVARQFMGEARRRRTASMSDEALSVLGPISDRPDLMILMPSLPWLGVSNKMHLAELLARANAFQALDDLLKEFEGMSLSDNEKARYLSCLGEANWAAGRWDEAAENFTEALQLPLSDLRRSSLLFRLARNAVRKGDREDAMSLSRQSVALSPNRDWVQKRVGLFFIEIGEYDEGVKHLNLARELAALPQEQCNILEQLMDVYKRLEKPEEFVATAEKYIETLGKIDPPLPDDFKGMAEFYQAEICRAVGDEQRAYQFYDRAVRLIASPERRFELHMQLAETDAKRGNQTQALAHANQAAALFPDSSSKNREVIAFMRRLGMEEQAEQLVEAAPWLTDLERALRDYSRQAELARRNGDEAGYLHNARLYVEAMENADQEIFPTEQSMAQYYRAEILRIEGKRDEAYAAYNRALELSSDRYRLSDIYLKIARLDAQDGRTDQAVARAGQAADLLPDRAWKQRDVGAFMLELGLLDKAEEYYQRALDESFESPARAEIFNTLANAFKKAGDQEKFHKYARLHDQAASSEDMAGLTPEDEEGIHAFYEGEFLAAQGNADEAYKAFERAVALLKSGPRQSEAYMKLAEYQVQRGQRQAAVASAEHSAVAFNDQPWKLREVGSFLLRLGEIDKATEYLEKASALAPEQYSQTARYYDSLAQAVKGVGDRAKFRHFAEQYLNVVNTEGYEPTPEEQGQAAYYSAELLVADGQSELAVKDYERALELLTNKYRLSEIHLKLADIFRENGDARKAIAQAELSAKVLPEQPRRHLQVGKLLLQLDMPDEALPHYVRWFEEVPFVDRNPAEMFLLARAFQAKGETAKAFEVLRMFMKADEGTEVGSEDSEGLMVYYEGRLYENQGEAELAFDAYKRASERIKDPIRLADIYKRMADTQIRLGNRAAAIAYAKQSAEALPDDPKKLRDTGTFFLRLGEMDEATIYVDRFIATNPPREEQAAVLAAVANAYRRLGKLDEYSLAIERYTSTITRDGRVPLQDEEGQLALFQADLYGQEGDLEAAFEAWQRAARIVTNRQQLTDIYYRMAVNLADRGRINEGIDYMERSLALLPNVPWKLRQAGGFYGRIEMTDKMLEYYHKALELSRNEENLAASHAALATVYKNLNDEKEFLNHAREFVRIQTDRDRWLDDEERGLRHFYQAQILDAEKKPEAAYVEYQVAVGLLSNPSRRADILYHLALYHADRGETTEALDLMERSVAELPNSPRKLRQAGSFAGRIKLIGKMFEFYHRALEASITPPEEATSLAALASAYRAQDDLGNYIVYAQQYVDLQNARETERKTKLDDEEKGLRHYYQAEIFSYDSKPDEAYSEYERASQLLTNPSRVADSYFQMASYQAERGNQDAAVELLERAIAQQESPARLRQAGGFAGRLGMHEVMLLYYERALALSTEPGERAQSLFAIANGYRSVDDVQRFLFYARDYVALQDMRYNEFGELEAEERGQRHYFQAEIYATEGDPEAAYDEYQKAITFISNPTRLSSIYYKMASYHMIKGDKSKAEHFMELSVAELPNQVRKLLQAAAFHGRLGNDEKMLNYYRLALEHSTTPAEKATTFVMLANAYRQLGDTEGFLIYAKQYIASEMARDAELNDEEKSLRHYYQAEIHIVENNPDEAYKEYELAASLSRNPSRLADIYYKMGLYHAEKGEQDLAVEFMEKSVAQQPPQLRKLRQAASFYGRLNLPERMFDYYMKALDQADTPSEKAASLASLAKAHKDRDDLENFLRYAEEYVHFQMARSDDLTDEERALRFIYQGEIQIVQNAPDAAFESYENALAFTVLPAGKADLYSRMADIMASKGEREKAAELMGQSVALQPDLPRKLRQAASFYDKLEMPERALEHYLAALEKSDIPVEKAASYSALADAYRSRGDNENYIHYARLFVDYQKARDNELNAEERGQREYAEAQLRMAEGDPAAAYTAYERASRLLKNPSRRSDAIYQMALYHAEKGEKEEAARLMELSVAELPNQPRKLRQAGSLFNRLEMRDAMFMYYLSALENSTTLAEQAESLTTLASAYKGVGDTENFLVYARRFVQMLRERDAELTDDERAQIHNYQAQIHLAENEPDLAYLEYVKAAELFTQPARKADMYYQLAVYHSDKGDQREAIRFITRFMELQPNEVRRHRQAGSLYNRLKLTERAVEHYRKVLDLAETPADRAAARMALAEAYRGGFPTYYLDTVKEYLRDLDEIETLTGEQSGFKHYYLAELYLAEDRLEDAIREYEEALGYVVSDSRRIDLHLRIAEYYAENRDPDLVAYHVDKALEVMPWSVRTMRRVAGIFNTAKLHDMEYHYFQRALELAKDFHEEGPIYIAMANSARALKREDRFLQYVQKYISLIRENWDEAFRNEQGTSWFYHGLIHELRKRRDEAYHAYQQAVSLLEEESRLSEAYLKMAQIDLGKRRRYQAAENALKAADIEPGKGSRISEAVRILNSLRRYHDSVRILERAIAMDPYGNYAGNSFGNDYLNKYLADTYVEGIDKKTGMEINRAYIDRLYDRLDNPNRRIIPIVNDDRVLNEWWDARRRQTRYRKNWGSFETRIYGRREDDGDYRLGTYSKLDLNHRLPNGIKFKTKWEIGWTMTSKSTSRYFSPRSGRWRESTSSSHMSDTFYAKAGVSYSPFENTFPWLKPLTLEYDHIFGIGRAREDDDRVRIKWDRSEGLSPRLYGNWWQYKKEEADLTHSLKNGGLSSGSTIRRGITYTPCWDRNLLIAPFGFVDVDYSSSSSSEKWGYSAGPGLVIRKYHMEDRYHYPRAYLEFNVMYRIGISKDQENQLSFNLIWSY